MSLRQSTLLIMVRLLPIKTLRYNSTQYPVADIVRNLSTSFTKRRVMLCVSNPELIIERWFINQIFYQKVMARIPDLTGYTVQEKIIPNLTLIEESTPTKDIGRREENTWIPGVHLKNDWNQVARPFQWAWADLLSCWWKTGQRLAFLTAHIVCVL